MDKKLEHIFELQKALDEEIVRNRNLEDIDTSTWIQKEVLAIMSELAELLDEVNFKWWKNPKKLDYSAIKEELVDILHFFVSMCIKVGMTPEELYRIYLAKNLENHRRQQGLSEKKGYKPQQ